MNKKLWFRGLFAAVVSGAAGGVLTGMASIGLAPEHFNLQDPKLIVKVAIAGAVANALIGLAAYLKQSPLPSE
jgi:hypothetical protein